MFKENAAIGRIPVVSADGTPLMPCKLAKAFRLLEAGKAFWKRGREGKFCLKLKFNSRSLMVHPKAVAEPKADLTPSFLAHVKREAQRRKVWFWLGKVERAILDLTIGCVKKPKSPRLIGGVGPNSTKIAAELFKTVCKTVIETDAQTAEIAKPAENTFRDVNIAFANQLALICEQHGVDATEVIKLANTHPRVNIHMPGPGVGGPCLPKDPYLLTHQAKPLKHDLIKTARKVNDYMPEHIIKMATQALKKAGKNPKNSKIAVIGTAYKADVDDPRESPSKPIIQKLIKHGAKVYPYDPHCKETFRVEKAETIQQALENADCTIILTDHAEFKNLNLQEIKTLMAEKPAIIDGKRIINPREAEKLGFFYYGVGFG